MDNTMAAIGTGVMLLGGLIFAGAFKASTPPEGVTDEMSKKYKFHQILGKGAYGTVYLVEHQTTKKLYAMKVIKEVRQGFTSREANVMKQLNHPNVTRLYDLSESSNHMNLVMDYMEGGSLQDRLNIKKKLSPNTARLYFYQMCRAIKYVHDKNITHRDLKPENMLLASNDDKTLLKVSDFGSGRNDQEYSLISNRGMELFRAPEYFMDEINRYSNKVDIWSLGVILYNCLTGEFPFQSRKAIVNNQCQFNQAVWKICSNDAIEIIKKMLNKNFQQRPGVSIAFEYSWLNNDEVEETYAQIIEEM